MKIKLNKKTICKMAGVKSERGENRGIVSVRSKCKHRRHARLFLITAIRTLRNAPVTVVHFHTAYRI